MNDQWMPWKTLSASVGVGVTTEGWTLALETTEPTVFEMEIAFSAPFNTVPVVQLALTGFDIDQRDSARISLKTKDITTAGFKVEISTWLETRIYGVEFSWLAIGA